MYLSKIKNVFVCIPNFVHKSFPSGPPQIENRNREQNVDAKTLDPNSSNFSMFLQGHLYSKASACRGQNMHQLGTILICLLRHFVKSDSGLTLIECHTAKASGLLNTKTGLSCRNTDLSQTSVCIPLTK